MRQCNELRLEYRHKITEVRCLHEYLVSDLTITKGQLND